MARHLYPRLPAMDMDMVELLGRCAGLELKAADFYDTLTRRFAGDTELARFWSAMAAEEREHARKLATWRELIAAEPPEQRPRAAGFGVEIEEIERLLDEACAAAATADEEEAFALALGLEGSEINAIYETLLRASPMARYPDFKERVKSESTGHHVKLLEMAGHRCKSERTRLRMELLAAHDR